VAGLLLLTAVAYAQVVGFEFTNYDDTAYVPDNAHVRDGFTLRGVGWAFTTFETANWYPLTWLSLMLDCQLFGPRPGVVHAVNALLHAANTVLLYVVLWWMTGRRWPSAAVAALFAVHPIHVESVAWVAERKDVLSTLFFLLALLAYQRYSERPSFGSWSLAFVSMAVGLLCKPMLVTLPFVLLLLDYWPLGPASFTPFVRRPIWLLFVEKLPLLALSAAASAVTMVAQASQGATKMIGDKVNLPMQLANAAIAYVKYLAMMFWPADLAVFYPYDFHPRLPLVMLSVAIVATITLAALLLVRRAPYVTVGWFWYLGTLVPTIGIVQVGAQGLADRYTYIPSIGIFIAIVWAVAEIARRPFVVAAAFTVATTALLVMARQQASYWVNSEILFRHALAVTGDNRESCENLGDTLLHHERFAEAETQFRKVLNMDSAKEFSQTPGELAHAIAGQSPMRVGEAIALVHESIPEGEQRAKALNDLALFLAPRGRLTEAIGLLQETIALAPKQGAGWRNLAWIYATCPDHHFRNGPKAVELARRACELTDWSNAEFRVTLADAYLETGNREKAIEELCAAQKISPKDGGIAKKLEDVLGKPP
jgi:tetratricopeptide (TPR) repeat protein